MRVIAGETKGRSLKPVPGFGTRPTADKVKESIFNIVGPFFAGGLGLDLYAGSGALGIEALSRGLDKVVFVDRDYKAVQTVKDNLQRCGYKDNSEVYRNDAKAALKALQKRTLIFSVIFLDPPYKKQNVTPDIEMLQTFQLVSAKAKIVVEHVAEKVLPLQIGNMKRYRHEVYGNTAISIFSF